MKKCKVCGDKTKWVVNINLKAVAVCHKCSKAIFIQTADWFIKNDNDGKFE